MRNYMRLLKLFAVVLALIIVIFAISVFMANEIVDNRLQSIEDKQLIKDTSLQSDDLVTKLVEIDKAEVSYEGNVSIDFPPFTVSFFSNSIVSGYVYGDGTEAPLFLEASYGKKILGYLSKKSEPWFQFVSTSKGYSEGAEVAAGQILGQAQYDWFSEYGIIRKTEKRFPYLYIADTSIIPSALGFGEFHMAVFKTGDTEFPYLGFAASNEISETDFLKVVNSVVIK